MAAGNDLGVSSWCHHSLLKPTAPVNFTNGRLSAGCMTDAPAREILRELTRTRAGLIQLLDSASSDPEKVQQAFEAYLELAVGLVRAGGGSPEPAAAPEPAAPAAADGADGAVDGGGAAAPGAATPSAPGPAAAAVAAKHAQHSTTGMGVHETMRTGLRYATMYKWRDILSREDRIFYDTQCDVVSICINVALWHCMFASSLGGSKTGSTDEPASKKVYHSLRYAAKVFKHVTDDQLVLLPFDSNTDFDERLMKCLYEQCLAEAQEVTLERARGKGYKSEVLAAIARDEYDRFSRAATMLASMERGNVAVFRSYLSFKAEFYKAYSLCYVGIKLFDDEECGKAIGALRQAQKALAIAARNSEQFRQTASKKGTKLRPVVESESFQDLSKLINLKLNKAESENGFIYHHKIPVEPLPLPAGKSFVVTEIFQAPMVSPKWAAAKFEPAKVPLKGVDLALDRTSSDMAKLAEGPNYIQRAQMDCAIL